MGEALGLIETRGLVGAIEAADAMVKGCQRNTCQQRGDWRWVGNRHGSW